MGEQAGSFDGEYVTTRIVWPPQFRDSSRKGGQVAAVGIMHMSQEPQPFDRADCVVSGYPHKPVALGHLTGTELPTRFTHKLPEVEGDGWTPGGLALLIAAAELHHVLHNQIPPGSVPPAGQS